MKHDINIYSFHMANYATIPGFTPEIEKTRQLKIYPQSDYNTDRLGGRE